MKKITSMFIITGLVLLGVGCGNQPVQTAGGGTGSELLGKALYPTPSGSTAVQPVREGRIYLFNENYLPDTASTYQAQVTSRTDNNGAFSVSDVQTGVYILEVVDSSGRSAATRVVVTAPQSVTLDTLRLMAPGKFEVPVLPTTMPATGLTVYMRVYGTRLVSRCSLDSALLFLENIPYGADFSINILIPSPVPISMDYNGIGVLPDSTFILPPITPGF